jgi:hypothetical protein
MNKTGWKRRCVVGATVVLIATTARSFWIGGAREVPIDRILSNIERRVAKDPNNSHSQYLLGRVHGAAFARGDAWVRMYGGDDTTFERDLDSPRSPLGCGPIASSGLQWRSKRASGPSAEHLAPQESCMHLTEAVRHLSRAVELAPDDALYHVGLACALDSGAHLAQQIDSTVIAAALLGSLTIDDLGPARAALDELKSKDGAVRDAAEKKLAALGVRALSLVTAYRADSVEVRQAAVARVLTSAWRELAIEHYDRAFALAFDHDKKLAFIEGEIFPDLVSQEAASSYIRLVEARGVRGDAEAKRLTEIKAGLATIKAIPSDVTPILVPDECDATLESLFDGASASFDLAGIRVKQSWPWPRANASFLVWDPECSGAINSGRQLFGSATWWMFFEDGYAALDALDDNDDGWLSGAELEGLSLWRDGDRDGVSDAGEVETLATRGIAALATRADGIDGLALTRSNGAVLSDGHTLPTFDWVASPTPRQ